MHAHPIEDVRTDTQVALLDYVIRRIARSPVALNMPCTIIPLLHTPCNSNMKRRTSCSSYETTRQISKSRGDHIASCGSTLVLVFRYLKPVLNGDNGTTHHEPNHDLPSKPISCCIFYCHAINTLHEVCWRREVDHDRYNAVAPSYELPLGGDPCTPIRSKMSARTRKLHYSATSFTEIARSPVALKMTCTTYLFYTRMQFQHETAN